MKTALQLFLVAFLLLVPMSMGAQSSVAIDGAWAGVIDVGMPLHIVFTFRTTDKGLTATLASPDQGTSNIPANAVTLAGHVLNVDIAKIGGHFAGSVDSTATRIAGTWTQNGRGFPLILSRAASAATLAPKRPQQPHPPFPYRAEDVSYPSTAPGVRLAATLTTPQGPGPFPAVLLISGSGPHDRDETVLGHKPFLVLADFLTRHGIAVLRADKRGIGQSTGDYATATLADYAADAEAGVAYLRSRPEIDRNRIGLLGHSEGGEIAPMVAAHHPDQVAFVVLLAGPGVPGLDIVVSQVKLISIAGGVAAPAAEANAATERAILEAVVAAPNSPALTLKLHNMLTAAGVAAASIPSSIATITSAPYRDFLTHDPASVLQHVRCPVLALNGSKDTQVDPTENLTAIRSALLAGGNTHVETVVLPNLNHLFQTAKTGAPSEYAAIEETMAPVALNKIADWIAAQPPLTTPKR